MQTSFSPTKRLRDFKSEENPHPVKQSKALSNEELLMGMAEILKEATTKLFKKGPYVSRHAQPIFKVKLHCFGERVPFTFKISRKGELTLIKEPKFLTSAFFKLNKPCQEAALGALSHVAGGFSQSKYSVISVAQCLTNSINELAEKTVRMDKDLSLINEDESELREKLEDQKDKLKLTALPLNLPRPESDQILEYDMKECVLIKKEDGFYPDRFVKKLSSGDLKFEFHCLKPDDVYSSIAFRSRNTAGKTLAYCHHHSSDENRPWPSGLYDKDIFYYSHFNGRKLNKEDLPKRLEWFQKNFQVENQESLDRILALSSEIIRADLGTPIEAQKVEGLPNFLNTPLSLNERVIIRRTDGSLNVGEVHAIFNNKVEIWIGIGIKKLSRDNLSAIVFRTQIPFLKLNGTQIEYTYDQWL